MNKKQKVKILSRLLVLHDRGVKPSLRAFGLSVKELECLEKEGLVSVGDNQKMDDRGYYLDDRDRYILFEIPSKGMNLLAAHDGRGGRSLAAKLLQGLVIGIWDLVKIAFGVILGWYLKTWLNGGS